MTLNYQRIDEILKEKKMSRRQLAELLNISPNTFTSAFVRKSKKSFSIEVANKISEILNVPLDDIVEMDIKLVELEPSKEDPDFAIKHELAQKFLAGLRKRRYDEQTETMNLYFDLLNEQGRDKAIEMVSILYRIPEYQEREEENPDGFI